MKRNNNLNVIMVDVKNREIKCIFFSEFHPTAGPKIAFQVPEEYIKKEEFDKIHFYIIPKPQLQNNIINIKTLHHRILGCPVIIDHKKYKRNALIFNLCLVFDTLVDTEKYESIVRKLAGYFKSLEVESEFLSNEESKQKLPDILKQLLTELNSKGACSIQINKSTTISLKVSGSRPKPCGVGDHDVPILDPTCPASHIIQQLDLSTQQILQHIDGFKHVAKIATEADIDIAIVNSCLQNLLWYRWGQPMDRDSKWYYGVIKLISVFQYSNVYTTCPDINHLYENVRFQEECVKYVARPDKLPLIKDVFTLYCGLTAGTTIKDLCARYNTHTLGIDERKLVQFGLVHGVIRRLHMYPIKLSADLHIHARYNWFNGMHSTDEISQKTGLSNQEVEEMIENDPSIVVCWK